MNSLSYTSAGLFPWKLLKHPELIRTINEDGRILPVHAQLIPTNRCNRNCPMCSCGKRDKQLEMSLEDAVTIADKLHQLGCKAVTITGGGEPLLHPHFASITQAFAKRGIEIGLVTNGDLLHTTPIEALRRLSWCRISNDDSRTMTDEYRIELSHVTGSAPNVGWAFSHVVEQEPNFEEIKRIVEFANIHKFTHVRLVSDLFMVEAVNLLEAKGYLAGKSVPDDRVIYQSRKEYTRGGDCRIGYLKPLIGPDCKVYGCCGVQYALATPSYDLPEELYIGDALELEKMYSGEMKPLNGRICVKCYYSGYNEALDNMLVPLEHEGFV